jgi:hypothetical protein
MDIEHRLAWFTGFMDGEGSIGIRIDHKPERPRHQYYLVAMVQFSITEKSALDATMALMQDLGIRGHGHTYQEKKLEKHLPSWHFRLIRLVDLYSLAPQVQPYAVIKQAQWALMEEYAASRLARATVDAQGRVRRGGRQDLRTYTEREIAIAYELRRLNLREERAVKGRNIDWLIDEHQAAAMQINGAQGELFHAT